MEYDKLLARRHQREFAGFDTSECTSEAYFKFELIESYDPHADASTDVSYMNIVETQKALS